MAYILCCVSGAKTEIMLIALNIVLSALNLVLYIAGKKRGEANTINLFAAGFSACAAIAIALM